MGAACSGLDVDDSEDNVNRNNFSCLSCFLPSFYHVYYSLFRRADVQAISSSIQEDNSIADTYRSPPLPLPYDADPQSYRMQRDGLFPRPEKGSSHSHDESEPLRSDGDPDSPSTTKCNASSFEDGSKENCKSFVKHSLATSTTAMGYFYPSSEDEECPTCLEEYTKDNPKIVTKCSHHFHLGCIYEWMERSERCPVCGKVMAFDESL